MYFTLLFTRPSALLFLSLSYSSFPSFVWLLTDLLPPFLVFFPSFRLFPLHPCFPCFCLAPFPPEPFFIFLFVPPLFLPLCSFLLACSLLSIHFLPFSAFFLPSPLFFCSLSFTAFLFLLLSPLCPFLIFLPCLTLLTELWLLPCLLYACPSQPPPSFIFPLLPSFTCALPSSPSLST